VVVADADGTVSSRSYTGAEQKVTPRGSRKQCAQKEGLGFVNERVFGGIEVEDFRIVHREGQTVYAGQGYGVGA